MNYPSSGGRRGGPIRAHLPGIYNYIMIRRLIQSIQSRSSRSRLCLKQREESLQPVWFGLQWSTLVLAVTELEQRLGGVSRACGAAVLVPPAGPQIHLSSDGDG